MQQYYNPANLTRGSGADVEAQGIFFGAIQQARLGSATDWTTFTQGMRDAHEFVSTGNGR